MRPLSIAAAALWFFACAPVLAQVATSQVAVTPNSGAYSAGQCVGGVLAVPNMVRAGGGLNGGIIVDVDIVDSSATNATIDLFVFAQAPTGTYTDHATCTIAAADRPFLQGVIFGAAATCAVDGGSTTGICRSTPALSITQDTLMSNVLWFLPIVRTTPTYGASKTLFFNITAMPQ